MAQRSLFVRAPSARRCATLCALLEEIA